MARRSGFTLIEILIAMAIVGILASAALVGLGSVRQTARDTRRIQDLHSVQTALELYYRKNGEYPDSMQWSDLVPLLQAVSGSPIPTDPVSSNAPYEYGSNGSSYLLKATLEGDDSALQTSPKDNLYGVDCSVAKAYCVKF